MSVQALSCAFAVRGISSSEKLVLLALANYANDKMVCWPSQERLAADTELSDRTVWGSLKGLEEKRLLSRVARKRADGTRATDVFTLHFALTVISEPLAKSANSTRKSCDDQSQIFPEPVAAVATLTTFEPPPEEPSLGEPQERAVALRVSPAFAAFWLAYPEKVGKRAALLAWERAVKRIAGPDPPAVIMAGVERAKLSRKWLEGKIPNPATWLNQDRWEDQPAETHERPHTDAKFAARQANLATHERGADLAARLHGKP